jgi:hypothetical protein
VASINSSQPRGTPQLRQRQSVNAFAIRFELRPVDAVAPVNTRQQADD